MRSIRALLGSAAHGLVRGLAVVALVVVWSFSHIGTYALSVVGVSKERLSEAVKNVGHSAEAVERELKRLA